jgi:hypothetical protein
VPKNKEELDQPIIEKWVTPFYMNLPSPTHEEMILAFADAASEIDLHLVNRLLGDFNWRSRLTGTYFAAINGYNVTLEVIGNHLLKSEVCYAGRGYCLALAIFGGGQAKSILATYLDYYLDRIDLCYDQAHTFCALEYLDNDQAASRLVQWNAFVADKPNWNLDKSRQEFARSIAIIDKIKCAKKA